VAFNNYLILFIIYFSIFSLPAAAKFLRSRVAKRSLSAQRGKTYEIMNKLCETKPNSEMLKMNITDYMTKDYTRKSDHLTMQKQTQTNPNHTRIKLKNLPASGGQSQNLVFF
jgi:hypothetical protein